MLSVDHVTKKYGDFLALEDITLDFEAGVYGLLAPNGAGKTTLINMLTTLLAPTRGEIRWDGTDIFALGEVYRDVLGYLPQQFGYYRDHTPLQFLRYLAALKGIPAKRAEKRILKLMELVGLSDVLNKKMKKFSGGMLQRVGIAAAMLNDPKILILDEPTAGLDPRERVRFRNSIHTLSKNRIVILSTHIVSDIETIASKIVMIRDHRLCCCKSPKVSQMRMIQNKLKKSIAMPMLWGFLAICLLFNICLAAGYRYKIVDYPFFSYVKNTASETGAVVGREFSQKLSSMPDSPHKNRLASDAAAIKPAFSNYDTSYLAEAYIGIYNISGAGTRLLKAKYEKLQQVVQRLDEAGAEFSLYSADMTAQMHDLFFGTMLRAIITEACILAALIMLHLCAYERQNKTEGMVYSSKTGRSVFRYKLWAGFLTAAICFFLIAAATLP